MAVRQVALLDSAVREYKLSQTMYLVFIVRRFLFAICFATSFSETFVCMRTRFGCVRTLFRPIKPKLWTVSRATAGDPYAVTLRVLPVELQRWIPCKLLSLLSLLWWYWAFRWVNTLPMYISSYFDIAWIWESRINRRESGVASPVLSWSQSRLIREERSPSRSVENTQGCIGNSLLERKPRQQEEETKHLWKKLGAGGGCNWSTVLVKSAGRKSCRSGVYISASRFYIYLMVWVWVIFVWCLCRLCHQMRGVQLKVWWFLQGSARRLSGDTVGSPLVSLVDFDVCTGNHRTETWNHQTVGPGTLPVDKRAIKSGYLPKNLNFLPSLSLTPQFWNLHRQNSLAACRRFVSVTLFRSLKIGATS